MKLIFSNQIINVVNYYWNEKRDLSNFSTLLIDTMFLELLFQSCMSNHLINNIGSQIGQTFFGRYGNFIVARPHPIKTSSMAPYHGGPPGTFRSEKR